MRWIFALVAIALVIGVASVVTSPSQDAASPEWLEPLIEDGRASLLDRLDLIEPGTPLAFTGARCRSDGTVVLPDVVDTADASAVESAHRCSIRGFTASGYEAGE
jgi:hypothetical protein